MNRIALFLAVAAAAGPAFAQGVPSTPQLECRAAQSLVSRSGSILLATGGRTYDRYYAAPNYCPYGLAGEAGVVPTRDNPQCFVGYYCTDQTPHLLMR